MTSRTPLGETRTHVASDHALIGCDSHVASDLFGWTNTLGIVLISPAMASATASSAVRGPGFAQYLAMPDADSMTTGAAKGVQRLVYVLHGEITLDGEMLPAGSFAYLPADSTYQLESPTPSRLLVFEKEYVSLLGTSMPSRVVGHVSELKAEPFMGDDDAMLACLLPTDSSFDMAINVFTYQSGAALPFVETHVMEHGLYMTEGQGIYRLADRWYPVAEGDSIWMAAYCPQWFVAMGKTQAQYVYYKDVNRNHLPITG